ncbi:hypothetical protein [Agarivorans litoreus]|uniref:hypothetical protein n=1 Tax=Agarivorans litoreus TaxID=1510455 RepID=UPI001C7D82F7|nr:hypothetical protein [Agarivorans litoreus]
MSQNNYRLYVDGDFTHYDTFENAQEAAKKHMLQKPELRIEILKELPQGSADFWAFEYSTNKWVPS